MHARKHSRPSWRTIAVAAFAVIIFAAIAAAGVFYAVGGRSIIVQTPSMGEYAPVGTLVLTTPTTSAQLHVGQTILFHPPTSPAETYFHRIVSIAGPVIRTKGDINGTIDPWLLHQSDLVGRELIRFVGVGTLFQVLPILLIGGTVVEILIHYYAAALWRAPLRALGWSALFAATVIIMRPLVRAVILTQTTVATTLTATLVPTGLLTLDAHAVNGTTTVLRPGQPGNVQAPQGTNGNVLHVLLAPHIDLITLTIIIALCLLPTLFCIAVVVRRPAGRHACARRVDARRRPLDPRHPGTLRTAVGGAAQNRRHEDSVDLRTV